MPKQRPVQRPDIRPSAAPIHIVVYRWAGRWGPFKIKVPCGECALTVDVVKDTISNELQGIPVTLDIREWLSEWWRPLRLGAWHAPIVLVEGQVVSVGEALNRGVLAERVMSLAVARFNITDTRIYGKDGCPHCVRAKAALDKAGVTYTYLDVVKNPGAMYEMFSRVKAIVGPKTPITVPQVWYDGRYVGGADQVEHALSTTDQTQKEAQKQSRRLFQLFGRGGTKAA